MKRGFYKMEDYEQHKRTIHAENEARRILKEIKPKCEEVLKGYIGKKVLKVDNYLLKELDEQFKPIIEQYRNAEIKPFNQDDETEKAQISHLYIQTSEYSLSIYLSLNFMRGSYDNHTYKCFYHEKSPYLASIRNKILEKINEQDEDYFKPINAEQQISLLKEAERKKEELEAIKDKLFYAIRQSL